MYKGKRENLPSEAIGTRFEEFPPGVYSGHEGYSLEKAKALKAQLTRDLLPLPGTLEIIIDIEHAPAGGFKVVNKSKYVKYPYC